MENKIKVFGHASIEGLQKALDKDGWFHIHADSGKPAYKERYKLVGDFFCGRAPAVDDKNMSLHIKTDGSPAYKERYSVVKMFTMVRQDMCLAVVMDTDGTCFHIDQDGNLPYPQRFYSVGHFLSGLSPVRDSPDGLYYYIKPDGTPAHGPRDRFDRASEFHKGVATVAKRGREFQILPDGTELVNFGKKG